LRKSRSNHDCMESDTDYEGVTMNTKTLIVGQDVYMIRGCEFYGREKGTVIKVTPEGADVLTTGGELMRFDTNGEETDVCRRDRVGFGPSPESKFHTILWYSAPEFRPWYLEEKQGKKTQ